MDISNRTLAFFLIAAIVVSVAGTMISLNKINNFQKGATGFAVSSAGNLSLYINKTAAIRFNPTCAINWGSGAVNTTAGNNNCTLNTTGSGFVEPIKCAGDPGFTAQQGCVLENYGNLRVNLSLNFSTNGTILLDRIGGSSGNNPPTNWSFNVSNNETDSCTNTQGGIKQHGYPWSRINLTYYTIGGVVCDNFTAGTLDTQNSLRIDFHLLIPSDSQSGTKVLYMTAIGEANEQ